ncbi:MAG: PepSY domain-containing protein, partial [Caulobacteraceae bacterium]|nr:PepSY domain-containing protein [Caulobacteraceae bacterium]
MRLLVRVASGETLTAFADPYDGHFIGATPFGGIMQLVRKVHSLQKFGFWASCLIEIVAGWAIVLVGTGVFLWWPRSETGGGVVSVRGSPSRRVFWRD